MKIIALSVPGPTPDPKKMDELAGEEARNAWELLKADVVREAYLRKDKTGGRCRAGGINCGSRGNGTIPTSLLSPWIYPLRPDTRRAIYQL